MGGTNNCRHSNLNISCHYYFCSHAKTHTFLRQLAKNLQLQLLNSKYFTHIRCYYNPRKHPMIREGGGAGILKTPEAFPPRGLRILMHGQIQRTSRTPRVIILSTQKSLTIEMHGLCMGTTFYTQSIISCRFYYLIVLSLSILLDAERNIQYFITVLQCNYYFFQNKERSQRKRNYLDETRNCSKNYEESTKFWLKVQQEYHVCIQNYCLQEQNFLIIFCSVKLAHSSVQKLQERLLYD